MAVQLDPPMVELSAAMWAPWTVAMWAVKTADLTAYWMAVEMVERMVLT